MDSGLNLKKRSLNDDRNDIDDTFIATTLPFDGLSLDSSVTLRMEHVVPRDVLNMLPQFFEDEVDLKSFAESSRAAMFAYRKYMLKHLSVDVSKISPTLVQSLGLFIENVICRRDIDSLTQYPFKHIVQSLTLQIDSYCRQKFLDNMNILDDFNNLKKLLIAGDSYFMTYLNPKLSDFLATSLTCIHFYRCFFLQDKPIDFSRLIHVKELSFVKAKVVPVEPLCIENIAPVESLTLKWCMNVKITGQTPINLVHLSLRNSLYPFQLNQSCTSLEIDCVSYYRNLVHVFGPVLDDKGHLIREIDYFPSHLARLKLKHWGIIIMQQRITLPMLPPSLTEIHFNYSGVELHPQQRDLPYITSFRMEKSLLKTGDNEVIQNRLANLKCCREFEFDDSELFRRYHYIDLCEVLSGLNVHILEKLILINKKELQKFSFRVLDFEKLTLFTFKAKQQSTLVFDNWKCPETLQRMSLKGICLGNITSFPKKGFRLKVNQKVDLKLTIADPKKHFIEILL
jgi:hypothetical protein